MQDRPTALELLRAIRDLLEKEILPALDDLRLRYQTLIAANVLRMLEREIPGEEERLRAELRRLHDLLGLPRAKPPDEAARLRRLVLDANQELTDRIRRGLADTGPWRARVLAHVRAAVEDKLRVNNPRQLEAFLAELDRPTPGDPPRTSGTPSGGDP
ncbi:MAG: hypothetical protein HY727_18935 [Candidatus Rokubacteria bacterium]|nr:hypothetical protein [Candidatus Rokubacteria bacterium]